MLKVSVRTVDRYIVAKKLSIELRDGRIWLNKEEIINIARLKGVDSRISMSTSSKPPMSIDGRHNPVSIDETESPEPPQNPSLLHHSAPEIRSIPIYTSETAPEPEKPNPALQIYKELYEELKEEIKIKQERIEAANYRVGQLEATLKETVSLPEHQKALLLERENLQQLRNSLEPLEQTNTQLKRLIKDEKFTKKVYLIILFIIMLLQPLWLFLSMK